MRQALKNSPPPSAKKTGAGFSPVTRSGQQDLAPGNPPRSMVAGKSRGRYHAADGERHAATRMPDISKERLLRGIETTGGFRKQMRQSARLGVWAGGGHRTASDCSAHPGGVSPTAPGRAALRPTTGPSLATHHADGTRRGDADAAAEKGRSSCHGADYGRPSDHEGP